MKNQFGIKSTGEIVDKITLTAGDLMVEILTLGAIIRDVRLRGVDHSLTLGSDSLAAYEGPMDYYGAVVGPVANRIGNASALLNGKKYSFDANEAKKTTLHGGSTGTHAQVWTIQDCATDFVELQLSLHDGIGGFPGNRDLKIRYEITAPATLTMRISATTDAPTFLNLANHSYWNLDGTRDVSGHTLQVPADHYIAVDEDKIPTGVKPVDGTPYDYRTPKAIGPESADRIDHNLCLADRRGPVRRVAELVGSSGVRMQISSTEPGLQVYDAEHADTAGFCGHHDDPYGAFSGVALEAQGWPDAPNRKDFPSVTLNADQKYVQVTQWTFSI